MKKIGSTGNIFNNLKNEIIQSNISLRPITSTHRNLPKKSPVLFSPKNNPIINFENESSNFNHINNNINNKNNFLLNKTSKQLYDELMSLKRRVNYLNGEISLAKSTRRKKDVQLNIKNKEIKSYLSDIRMSKDLNPINIDKLKETNIIGKLKKEFYILKNNLNEIKIKKKELELKLKKAKPNIIRQSNIILENKLKSFLQEYYIIQEKNNTIFKELEEMKNISIIFEENHKKIKILKERIEDKEKKINILKDDKNKIMNKQNLKEELIDRQIIKNKYLNKKNIFLENEIENKKKILSLKKNYKNKINELTEKKNELEEKFKSNDRYIKEIKEEIKEIEKIKQLDPLKLNVFDYSKIKKIEKNPDEICNSKILLLQSLINESNNNKKKYQDLIEACIEKFQEIGYDYSELDKMIDEEEGIKEINNEEKKDNIDNVQIENDIKNKEQNEEIKENNKNDENNNNVNNDVNNNIDNKNLDNNNLDNNNLNNNENKENDIKNEENYNNIQEINKEENNKNEKENEIEENINNSINDKKDKINENKDENKDDDEKRKDEIIIDDNNKNDIINNDNDTNKNNEINENNKSNESKKENENIIKENEIKNETNKEEIIDIKENEIENKNGKEDNNSENDINNNGIISDERQLIPKENKTPESENKENEKENGKNENILSNDEFSEFTYILIKNFECKKINEEIARQKIIIITTKEEIENNRFIEQMSFNIMKAIHNENKDSLEKVKNWIYTLLNMCENDQKKMTENFLSLFSNINIYNSEQELTFSKKIKKSFLEKKDIIYKKLEPFKNKYISFHFLKQLIEELNIELKEEYAQYLFYELKKFDDPNASLYDLKVQNLYNILENNQNDSKMETESDIEITNEQYVNIVTNFGIQLLKYLDTNKTDLRTVLGDLIQNLSGPDAKDGDKIEVVLIEPFVNKMKEIGIVLNSEIEIYCLFSRYKLSDDYEIISVNLLEKELENFRTSNILNYANINEINDVNGINGINGINNVNNINGGVGINIGSMGNPEGNNLKVMEKVQEENEDNISNSDNK